MTRVRIAVVGAGHLGRIHAKLLSQHDQAELVAVVDPDRQRCRQVADECRTSAASHHATIVGQVEAAIVAAPNLLHAEIGCELLNRGIHVLMEKPLATTLSEADQLVEAAEQHNCVLQVGHVERFNPAFQAAAAHVRYPKYIETRRTSGYPARSTDVGAVLDLMIHDIDLVLELAQSEVTDVSALGASVLGGHEDMAQARLSFASGCIADLVASRVSFCAERKMNVYCRTAFASVNFAERTTQLVTPNQQVAEGLLSPSDVDEAAVAGQLYPSLLQKSELPVAETNAIGDEHTDFMAAIVAQQAPHVTGADGRSAVAVAERILDQIHQHQWNGTPFGPVGPHAEPASRILRPPVWPTARPTRKAG